METHRNRRNPSRFSLPPPASFPSPLPPGGAGACPRPLRPAATPACCPSSAPLPFPFPALLPSLRPRQFPLRPPGASAPPFVFFAFFAAKFFRTLFPSPRPFPLPRASAPPIFTFLCAACGAPPAPSKPSSIQWKHVYLPPKTHFHCMKTCFPTTSPAESAERAESARPKAPPALKIHFPFSPPMLLFRRHGA